YHVYLSNGEIKRTDLPSEYEPTATKISEGKYDITFAKAFPSFTFIQATFMNYYGTNYSLEMEGGITATLGIDNGTYQQYGTFDKMRVWFKHRTGEVSDGRVMITIKPMYE